MAKAIDSNDATSDKVGKLLPSEVTGLYLSVRAVFSDAGTDKISGYILLAMAVLSLLASLIYIYSVRKVRNRLHLFIYSMTFVLWALSLDTDRVAPMVDWLVPEQYVGRIIAALSLIWTFAISAVPSQTVSSDAKVPDTASQPLSAAPPA